jgi:hypothetical protein
MENNHQKDAFFLFLSPFLVPTEKLFKYRKNYYIYKTFFVKTSCLFRIGIIHKHNFRKLEITR